MKKKYFLVIISLFGLLGLVSCKDDRHVDLLPPTEIPSEPEEPNKPDEPETPTKPSEPEEPSKPSEPETPDADGRLKRPEKGNPVNELAFMLDDQEVVLNSSMNGKEILNLMQNHCAYDLRLNRSVSYDSYFFNDFSKKETNAYDNSKQDLKDVTTEYYTDVLEKTYSSIADDLFITGDYKNKTEELSYGISKKEETIDDLFKYELYCLNPANSKYPKISEEKTLDKTNMDDLKEYMAYFNKSVIPSYCSSNNMSSNGVLTDPIAYTWHTLRSLQKDSSINKVITNYYTVSAELTDCYIILSLDVKISYSLLSELVGLDSLMDFSEEDIQKIIKSSSDTGSIKEELYIDYKNIVSSKICLGYVYTEMKSTKTESWIYENNSMTYPTQVLGKTYTSVTNDHTIYEFSSTNYSSSFIVQERKEFIEKVKQEVNK